MIRSMDGGKNVSLQTEEMGSRSMLVKYAEPTLAGRIRAAVMGAACVVGLWATPSFAEDSRTLDLYNAHTKERLTITFKKNGRYIPSALTELNQFLRDWRRNESIRMDPRLFDTVWEVYRRSGSRQPIHVVCGYRSLATNDMLRSRSSAVAKHSQHTLGKAMDLFIPDVSVNRVREIGISLQRGGVGWYPSANSPFVHIDVGNVRAWPRMTRAQLVKIFPDGKTVHLPADGKPLPGYQAALAEIKKNGGSSSAASYADSSSGSVKKGGLLAMLFGDEEDGNAEVSASADEGGVPAKPAKAAKAAPVIVADAAPKPAPAKPETTLAQATLPGIPDSDPAPAPVAAVAAAIPAPKPRIKPDVPAAVPDPTLVAAIEPAAMPRSKPALPEPMLVAAAEPVPPVPPAAPVVAAAPQLPEPANAQMALAEVARDRLTTTDSTTALGYASATEASPAPAVKRPLLQTASLSGGPIVRSLGGRSDSLTALPVTKDEASDPMASLKSAPVADNLPIFDGAQSAYWGVFATMVHPDQRDMAAMMIEPVKVVVSGFGAKPYQGQLTSVRFTGTALPRLQVMHFEARNDLAMR